MDKEKVIATTVSGLGFIEAKNDLVSFSLTLRTKADSLEESKSQIQNKTQDVLSMLEKLEMKLHTEILTDISNYKLEHRESGERYAAGYQSTSTISWTAVVDEKLNEIYKACFKVDSNMPRPFFSIKDREPLLQAAIQKAANDVKAKLNRECDLLNISPNNLKILNWNFGYEGYLPTLQNTHMIYNSGVNGVTGVIGPSGSISSNFTNFPVSYVAPVQKVGSIYQELVDFKPLQPGMVSVRVPVQVNYIWNE